MVPHCCIYFLVIWCFVNCINGSFTGPSSCPECISNNGYLQVAVTLKILCGIYWKLCNLKDEVGRHYGENHIHISVSNFHYLKPWVGIEIRTKFIALTIQPHYHTINSYFETRENIYCLEGIHTVCTQKNASPSFVRYA